MGSEIWVVTGVDDDARGLAHEAAGRAGLSTGAWIERAIGRSASVPPAPTAPIDEHPVEEDDDPGETEMIAALHAIGQRIEESGDRLAARTADAMTVEPAPVAAAIEARTTEVDDTEPHEYEEPSLERPPLSIPWRTATIAACAAIAVAAVALSQLAGVVSIWYDKAENGQTVATAGRPLPMVQVEPNIVSGDLRIAAVLTTTEAVSNGVSDSKLLSALRQAAAAGDARAQHSLGLLYATRHVSSPDRRRAPIWLHRAAAQGLPEAAYHLGVIYEQGDGVAKDRPKAIRFYRRAADSNHPRAQHNLAVALAAGSSAADFSQIAAWLKAAANAGIPESQFGLAVLFEQGLGVARDPGVAVAWRQRAADGGHAGARAWLVRAATGERLPDGHFRDLVRPLGFDPKMVDQIARLTKEGDPRKDSQDAPIARHGAEESYLLLLGSSLGEIEFSAPSPDLTGPARRPDDR